MRIRGLDNNGDFQFGSGKANYLNNQPAIALNIRTRLLSFLGNCWFDSQAGIDWLTYLGTSGAAKNQKNLLLSIQAIIKQSYGVVSINSLSAGVSGRMINIQANINTIFTSNYNLNVSQPV